MSEKSDNYFEESSGDVFKDLGIENGEEIYLKKTIEELENENEWLKGIVLDCQVTITRMGKIIGQCKF